MSCWFCYFFKKNVFMMKNMSFVSVNNIFMSDCWIFCYILSPNKLNFPPSTWGYVIRNITFLICTSKMEWGSEYQTSKYQKHLDTELLLLWYSDALCGLQSPLHNIILYFCSSPFCLRESEITILSPFRNFFYHILALCSPLKYLFYRCDLILIGFPKLVN